MTNAILRGKPYAGNPHVRFDEGEVASAKPRRGSLLYKIGKSAKYVLTVALAALGFAAQADEDEAVGITVNGDDIGLIKTPGFVDWEYFLETGLLWLNSGGLPNNKFVISGSNPKKPVYIHVKGDSIVTLKGLASSRSRHR